MREGGGEPGESSPLRILVSIAWCARWAAQHTSLHSEDPFRVQARFSCSSPHPLPACPVSPVSPPHPCIRPSTYSRDKSLSGTYYVPGIELGMETPPGLCPHGALVIIQCPESWTRKASLSSLQPLPQDQSIHISPWPPRLLQGRLWGAS